MASSPPSSLLMQVFMEILRGILGRSTKTHVPGGIGTLPVVRTRVEVIVIGGGHAGCEAAWASAAVLGGGRVAMSPATIGAMSCNPAIGGLAKGQMVREIDALGGLMGRAIDATGIQFRMLNTSKGPAVRGPRAQADRHAYAEEVQRLIASTPAIEVVAATVDDLVEEDGRVRGVLLGGGVPRRLDADAVVLTTGTFMRALMHTGAERTPGGRVGEGVATGIATALHRLGFETGRLKTGTPPRLDRATLDWEGLEAQWGDDEAQPFSDLSPGILPGGRFPRLSQVECRMTCTTRAIHDLVHANLHRAPMYCGALDAECGPRYCPSLEDKVVRFPDRDAHHVYLEPESLDTDVVYCNGISTSLPRDVQEGIVHGMPGCERARILRWGYVVEYDMIRPHQIDATTMTKRVEGLFLAGQINGTSGYEEAAGQGVVAGCNAARFARGESLVRLRRDQAYIGVMLDDLVTKTPREPYRMFTSRAEHRLLLRADNADERLTAAGREWGLVGDDRWRAWEAREQRLSAIRRGLDTVRVEGRPLRELARRPGVAPALVASHMGNDHPIDLVKRVMTDLRYEGYVARQRLEIRRQARAGAQSIPSWLEPSAVTGLRAEAVEALARFQPATFAQAARLEGISPADMTLLAVAVRRGPPVPVAAS